MRVMLVDIGEWWNEKKWSIAGWAVVLFAYVTLNGSASQNNSIADTLMMAVGAIIFSFVIHALWAIANGIFSGHAGVLNRHRKKKDKSVK